MNNLGKIAAGVGSVVIIAAGIYALNQMNNQNGGNGGGGGGTSDAGIDVSNTPCDGLAAARAAVEAEYQGRIEAADSKYSEDRETASDAYWEKYRELEQTKWDCEGEALLTDPCKELFERSSALAKQILDNIDQGYDEAKSAERDRVKEEYDDCLENPPEEETYEDKKAKCAEAFDAGVATAQAARDAAETAAESARDAAKATAESQKASKVATLDAIAEACNVPPPVTGVTAGGITTEGTGTVIESGNPACTGNFAGYDPELQAEINRLQTLMEQARLKDRETGIGGAGTYAESIRELRAEMAAGPKKCTTDADCGDTTKVCCSETEVGWVVCSGGECATEKEECEDEAVCAGKPAACVGGSEGAESAPISISRVYIIGSPCNSRIQVLDLQPKDENSVRYEIVGNVPQWLGFTPVGGTLPQNVDVTADCNTLQTEGTYSATAKILIRNQNNELINTIPVNVEIEAIRSIVEEDETAISTGLEIDLTDEESEEEALSGGEDVIIEDEEEQVAMAPQDVSFTYDHANPICPLPITPVVITGEAGSTWTLVSDLPIWLSLDNTSGTIPQTINMQFPCLLNRYENQQQSATLNFQVTTPGGQITNTYLDIDGNFTNF